MLNRGEQTLRAVTGSGGRLHFGMVAGIKSERWPTSNRNPWPDCVGIRTWRFLAQAQDAIAAAELSNLTRELFADMLDELRALDLRLDKLDRQLLALCRTNEACRCLSKLPGAGPVV